MLSQKNAYKTTRHPGMVYMGMTECCQGLSYCSKLEGKMPQLNHVLLKKKEKEKEKKEKGKKLLI